MMAVIVGRTDEEARAKYEEYRRYVSVEAALTLMSGWTGIDFSQYDLDQKVERIRNDAIHSVVDAFTTDDPIKVWTIREVVEYLGVGGYGPVIVGSPQRVADELQAWIDETDVDGFNLAYTVTPQCYIDFVELVVPELQRRGVYKQEYSECKTYREKLFGGGARLGPEHPAARHRYRYSQSEEKTNAMAEARA
jgi:alkanesulfonate monooxygenase